MYRANPLKANNICRFLDRGKYSWSKRQNSCSKRLLNVGYCKMCSNLLSISFEYTFLLYFNVYTKMYHHKWNLYFQSKKHLQNEYMLYNATFQCCSIKCNHQAHYIYGFICSSFALLTFVMRAQCCIRIDPIKSAKWMIASKATMRYFRWARTTKCCCITYCKPI